MKNEKLAKLSVALLIIFVIMTIIAGLATYHQQHQCGMLDDCHELMGE